MMPLPSMSGSGGSATSGDVTTGSTVFAPAFGAFAVGGKETKQGGATATASAGEPTGSTGTASAGNWMVWLAVVGVVASVLGLLAFLKKRRK